eukprot:COSAG06_NODE_1725_length_8579_cov_14.164151_4_plen_725_part_00
MAPTLRPQRALRGPRQRFEPEDPPGGSSQWSESACSQPTAASERTETSAGGATHGSEVEATVPTATEPDHDHNSHALADCSQPVTTTEETQARAAGVTDSSEVATTTPTLCPAVRPRRALRGPRQRFEPEDPPGGSSQWSEHDNSQHMMASERTETSAGGATHGSEVEATVPTATEPDHDHNSQALADCNQPVATTEETQARAATTATETAAMQVEASTFEMHDVLHEILQRTISPVLSLLVSPVSDNPAPSSPQTTSPAVETQAVAGSPLVSPPSITRVQPTWNFGQPTRNFGQTQTHGLSLMQRANMNTSTAPTGAGRGRGRARTTPSWMTHPEVGLSQAITAQAPTGAGRGRGRTHTRPAWMTHSETSSEQASATYAQRADTDVVTGPGGASRERGRTQATCPDLAIMTRAPTGAGRGRGRIHTRPAWMTHPETSSEQATETSAQQADTDASDRVGRGRGRTQTRPAWMTHPSTSQDQARRDDNDTYTRSVEPQMPVSQLSSRTSPAPSDTNRRSRTNARVVVRYSDGSLVAPVTGTAALEHSDSSDVTDEYSPDSAVSDVATSDQVMRRVLGAQPTEAPTQPGHSSDDTCPVCYGTLTTHPQLGHAVPWPTCGHMAHTACMYRAMQASNRCMLCRTPAERAVGNVTAPSSGQHGRVHGVYAEAARAWSDVLEGLSNSDLRQMAISCGMSPERCEMCNTEMSNVTRSSLTDFLRHYPVSYA